MRPIKEQWTRHKKQAASVVPRPSSVLCLLPSVLCLLFFAGCSLFRTSPGSSYFSGPSKNLSGIRTLTLVELQNNTVYPQVSGDVTESLYQALLKTRGGFDLAVLGQNHPDYKNLPIRPGSPDTLEQLLATRKMLGADAVIIGTVTSYTPYPHMAMGLNLKLIDLRDGRVPWKIEQVWDTSDKAAVEKIKKYFNRELRSDFSPLDEKLALLSPINFIKFVTYDVVQTLGP
jgi:hypothetical protein